MLSSNKYLQPLLVIYAVCTVVYVFKRIFINIFAGMSSDAKKEGAAEVDAAVMNRRQRNVANDLENEFGLSLFWAAYVAVLTGSIGGTCTDEALALCILFPLYVTARLVHVVFHLNDPTPAPATRTVAYLVGVACILSACGVLLAAASRTSML